MAPISVKQKIVFLSMCLIIVADTKENRSRKNITFSDKTTKILQLGKNVQDLMLSTTMRTSPLSTHIKVSKSRLSLASKKIRIRKNNKYPSRMKILTPISLRRPNENDTTQGPPLHTSSLSGWPLLKDVIPRRNNRSREVHKKKNMLIKDNKKLNTKSRKRLKRRRRILERKGHNRARKLTKQKLKIKSRMKNNSIVHQKKKERKLSRTNLFDSHVANSDETSVLKVASNANKKVVISSRHENNEIEKVHSKNRVFNRSVLKAENSTSMKSHQITVINQDQPQPTNDSMLADQAQNILSGLEPEVSMMDYAWNEDKIEIDFKTGRHYYYHLMKSILYTSHFINYIEYGRILL